MVGPFPKKAISPDEWRSKARAFQAQLEGLSIEELMRGPIDEARPAGSAGRHDTHARDQPRAPKGHPDGGQWVPTGHAASRLAAVHEQGDARNTVPARLSIAAEARGTLHNANIAFQGPVPPGVFPEGAPPESC
jgi:hypothetical protein